MARAFGAGDVGITARDERWMYSAKMSDMSGIERPVDIPPRLSQRDRDRDADGSRAAAHGALGAVGRGHRLGYSHDTMTLLAVTQYLRNLGYEAIASANDSALAVPLAIKAGLGEYGRLGLLITRNSGRGCAWARFSPTCRSRTTRRRFGVQGILRGLPGLCPTAARSRPCPSRPPGPPPPGPSYLRGVIKWTVDAEKCFGYWAQQNTDCAICIRVCPYNRDFTRWPARLWRRLAGSRWRRLALWLDARLGHGRRLLPSRWWAG
jgi:epoxyqueuosine reductase